MARPVRHDGTMTRLAENQRRIVDVHAHFVPPDYRSALAAAGNQHPDGSPIPPWSADAHVEMLDRLEISTAMLSLSSPGVDVDGRPAYWARAVNEFGAGVRAAQPGRFGWLASLPLPDVDASLAEIAYASDELHADGFALLTHGQDAYLGDPSWEPVMAELNRRRAVVFVHPTSPCGCAHVDMGRPAPLLEYLFDTTRAIVNLVLSGVLQRHPEIRWIIPHNGAALPAVVDRVALFQQHILHSPDEIEITHALRRLYYEVGSSAPFPRTAEAARALTSDDHLLVGTDLPYAPPPAVEANLRRLVAGEILAGDGLDRLCHGIADFLFPGLTSRA